MLKDRIIQDHSTNDRTTRSLMSRGVYHTRLPTTSSDGFDDGLDHELLDGIKYVTLLSLLLWWIPFFGQAAAGYVGGRKAGTPVKGLVASLIPVVCILSLVAAFRHGLIPLHPSILNFPSYMVNGARARAPFAVPYLAGFFGGINMVFSSSFSAFSLTIACSFLGGIMAEQNRKEIALIAGAFPHEFRAFAAHFSGEGFGKFVDSVAERVAYTLYSLNNGTHRMAGRVQGAFHHGTQPRQQAHHSPGGAKHTIPQSSMTFSSLEAYNHPSDPPTLGNSRRATWVEPEDWEPEAGRPAWQPAAAQGTARTAPRTAARTAARTAVPEPAEAGQPASRQPPAQGRASSQGVSEVMPEAAALYEAPAGKGPRDRAPQARADPARLTRDEWAAIVKERRPSSPRPPPNFEQTFNDYGFESLRRPANTPRRDARVINFSPTTDTERLGIDRVTRRAPAPGGQPLDPSRADGAAGAGNRSNPTPPGRRPAGKSSGKSAGNRRPAPRARGKAARSDKTGNSPTGDRLLERAMGGGPKGQAPAKEGDGAKPGKDGGGDSGEAGDDQQEEKSIFETDPELSSGYVRPADPTTVL